MSEAVIPPVPKVDPESSAIRTKPARAIRFRRGVIIAIAALGSVSLMAVAWIALKPRVLSAVADRQELSEPSNRPSTDALNGLPATDASGYAGLQDKVNFHTWALLKGVALSTLLDVGSQLALRRHV